ncbi:3-phenylpropionate/trans-cinnamate dioxygenase ferredoxin reductase subunit [Prauserella sediminis]|uniref:3-phenylpropionate/trans-cinnamate dioxygenase ferredoxin reductase subunit n=1 Tax=Prauserella sediminis TaxID=577680 RepID=A0A839Y0M4_9PSEU|nr:FAD-dependent oxidoreductase [Prauserella sediminis]MBB3665505.1 3-phenylpropionate/trans-cinnamate dioxygenase ferredoxin reductase subunit [Prauserella sediminis]
MTPRGTHRVVIVGAGLGGLRVAEHLRRQRYTGAITLVGDESAEPYDRPPLSKAVLVGTMTDTTLAKDIPSLDLDLRLGTRVETVDTSDRSVVLSNGDRIGYDSLVLAPGAVPRLPAGVGVGGGVHVLRTIADSLGIRAAIADGRRLVVVGAGFIGCEVAASARRAGVDVDLVERLSLPLVQVLGEAGGRRAAELHREHGVRLHLGTGATPVTGPDGVRAVRLDDGTELECRDIVYGIGVTPDVEWLAPSGIALDDGILCDSLGRTSIPGVFAVGDAARWWHPLLGAHRRLEHWMSTTGQAETVAHAITAGDDIAVPTTVPFFWSDQYDVKIQGLGFVDPSDDVRELEVDGKPVLVYSRDNVLRAVVGFSVPTAVLPLRKSIMSGVDVDEVVARLTE